MVFERLEFRSHDIVATVTIFRAAWQQTGKGQFQQQPYLSEIHYEKVFLHNIDMLIVEMLVWANILSYVDMAFLSKMALEMSYWLPFATNHELIQDALLLLKNKRAPIFPLDNIYWTWNVTMIIMSGKWKIDTLWVVLFDSNNSWPFLAYHITWNLVKSFKGTVMQVT